MTAAPAIAAIPEAIRIPFFTFEDCFSGFMPVSGNSLGIPGCGGVILLGGTSCFGGLTCGGATFTG